MVNQASIDAALKTAKDISAGLNNLESQGVVNFNGVVPSQAIKSPTSVEIPEQPIDVLSQANSAILDEALRTNQEFLTQQQASKNAEAQFRQTADSANITATDFINQSQGITNQLFSPEQRRDLQRYVEDANADSVAIARLDESVREGRGIQSSIARGQVAREKALLQISQTANLANAEFLRGNENRARELAGQAIGVEINSRQQALENEKIFLEREYDKLDAADKKKADARLLEISNLQNQAEEVKTIGSNSILNGAPKELVRRISEANTAQEAREIAGEFGVDAQVKSSLATDALQRQNIRSQIADRQERLSMAQLEVQAADIGVSQEELRDVQNSKIESDTSLLLVNDLLSSDFQIARAVGPISSKIAFSKGEQDFRAKYDSLVASLQLENISKLKGTGTITDSEQETLRRAATAMTLSGSEKNFKQQLTLVSKVFERTSARSEATLSGGSLVAVQTPDGEIGVIPTNELDDAVAEGYNVLY